ncbi:phosphoribosylanthranilate isomerase [Lacticaseibacillus pabuli]|uniref:N-(5'-phosphoribosyl)anthranilate isomerase n=1 Tax=Lacticaseibacillus pabuli TaxID=3025672 RepID=A0ABY7WT26_9LACO|nr:phosphoribosylanthranilate isomerase [Lacticaseibacillus sp. KACC 23028]WDF82901.1 phosphoribosylanthranilate isomerase [Lacticaseibacillus sp. KACC 23028]
MTAIKICGLMRQADITAVNAAMPEYAGFVFAGGRHHLTPDQARPLIAALAPMITPVGVFKDNSAAEINAALTTGIQVVQLHGNEDEDLVRRLQARGVRVIRAFVGQPTSIPDTAADYVMLDAGAGSGKQLDWFRIPRPRQPLFLAGGITPDNIDQAIQAVHPDVIDVSSGAETNGLKDSHKINALVASAHQQERIVSYE